MYITVLVIAFVVFLSLVGSNVRSVWGRSQGKEAGQFAGGWDMANLFASAASGAGQKRFWPMPRPLTEFLWIKQQSLDSVINQIAAPLLDFPFLCAPEGCSVSAVLISQGYFPGKKCNVLLFKCLPGCWDSKDMSPTKEVEPFHQLHVKFRNRRE